MSDTVRKVYATSMAIVPSVMVTTTEKAIFLDLPKDWVRLTVEEADILSAALEDAIHELKGRFT